MIPRILFIVGAVGLALAVLSHYPDLLAFMAILATREALARRG